MKHHATRLATAAAVVLLTLSGCAGLGKPPETAVLERAQARWDAIVAGNLSEAYEYLSPGYRSAVSLNAWQRRILGQRIEYSGARAIESECEEDACKVTISLDYAVVGALRGVNRFERTTKVQEDWIRTDGEWFHVPPR